MDKEDAGKERQSCQSAMEREWEVQDGRKIMPWGRTEI